MKPVAITGGIAEGKSTVLGYLAEAGYSVESADRLARQVFESPEVQEDLARLLSERQPITPLRLKEAITADAALRRAANSLMHPRILRLMLGARVHFLEIPLLCETCLQGLFERVWVVTCGEEEQLRRLTARTGDESSAKTLIGTQLTSRVKIAFADRLVRTNQPESTVMRFVTVAAQRDLR